MLSRFEDDADDRLEAGRYLEILSGEGSALRKCAVESPETESRLRDRWWRTVWSEMVAIALCVRSMAEAANAKKPPCF